MTLYSGSPAEDDLSEIASAEIDPLANTDRTTLPFGTDQTGTFYLEMTYEAGSPTWWWARGDARLRDVGGSAFVDREARTDANFIFSVVG